MFEHSKAFTSFSVKDIRAAKHFYGDLLGLSVKDVSRAGCPGLAELAFEGGARVMMYEKEDHQPATFTVLNFPVAKIEAVVKELRAKGIEFEHYDQTDADGISRGDGPTIAWFKDPFGNFISVLEETRATAQADLALKRFFPESRERLFSYFTKPELIERWCHPDGMTLKVSQYEPKVGGSFRFEHTIDEGVWVCTGYIREYVPAEKLVQIETVRNPEGTLVIENSPSTIWFERVPGGTEIRVEQSGLPDNDFRDECEAGWTQSFDNLSNLLTGGLGTRPDHGLGEGKPLLHR